MQPTNPCVFVDQIFNCESVIDDSSTQDSVLPGLSPHLMGAPPLYHPPPPEPGALLGFGGTEDEMVIDSPPGVAVASDEIDPGNFDATSTESAEVTKVTDGSFNMNSLPGTLNVTTMDSGINSMMVDCPAAEEMDQLVEFKTSQKDFLACVNMDSPHGISAQCDAESAQFGSIFARESPWEPPNSSFDPQTPVLKAVSVQERVQIFEEISKSGGAIKCESSSNIASPCPDLTPDTSPEPQVKIKIEEIDGVAPSPNPTPESPPSDIDENRATDYYNTARHPTVDGNNSDDEDYGDAADLGVEDSYDRFANEIIDARGCGMLAQSSPRKGTEKLFVNRDSSAIFTNTTYGCDFSFLSCEADEIPQTFLADSYEDNSCNLPQIAFDEEANAAEPSDTAMEDCDADAISRASLLQPSGSQPHCDSRKSPLSQVHTKVRRARSGPSSPLAPLEAPTPQRARPLGLCLTPSVGTVVYTAISDSHGETANHQNSDEAADNSPLPAYPVLNDTRVSSTFLHSSRKVSSTFLHSSRKVSSTFLHSSRKVSSTFLHSSRQVSQNYTHLSQHDASLGPQIFADYDINDYSHEGSSQELGISSSQQNYNYQSNNVPNLAPLANQNQAIESCALGSSDQPLECLDFWKATDLVGQTQPINEWELPATYRVTSSVINANIPELANQQQYEVAPSQSYQQQQLDNTAYNGQYQETVDVSGYMPNSNWSNALDMAVPSLQPQLQNAPANFVLDSCQGASILEAPQQLMEPPLPPQRGPSLYLQTPTLDIEPQSGLDSMDICTDGLFSDIPRPTVDRVVSFRNPPNGLLSDANVEVFNPHQQNSLDSMNNIDRFALSELSEGFNASLQNMGNQESNQLDSVPRSYFVDPNYLGLSEVSNAEDPLQRVGQSSTLETSNQQEHELAMDFLNDPQIQEMQQFQNELQSTQPQVPPAPQEPQQPQQPQPVQQEDQALLAPYRTQNTTGPREISSVFIRPARMRRGPRGVPRNRAGPRVAKPTTREGPSSQLRELITETVNQAITEQSIPEPTVQEERPATITLAVKSKRQRKEKTIFNYDNIKIPQRAIEFPILQNYAVGICNDGHLHKNQLVSLNGSGECQIRRIRYQRNTLEALQGLHSNVYYEKNSGFDSSHPYQQEFTRIELDAVTGQPRMETRSALCAYCEEVNFYELKNSCYSQHMSHSHGIYTDNFLTPNPLFSGSYQVSKKPSANRKTQPRIRFHEGVVCPACFEVVEIRCWSSTSEKKPYSNYLRHFKERHRVDKRKETFFDLRT